MRLDDIKLETLKKGIKQACLTEAEVCSLGKVNRLDELTEERYLDCLIFLMKKARGET